MKSKILLLFLLLSVETTFAQSTQEISKNLIDNNWSASWISYPDSGNKFGVYHFRKKVTLGKIPTKFIIHVSADNRYWLFINGKRIATGPAKSTFQHWNFESLDIAPWLTAGENIIAATVWNHADYRGWSQLSTNTSFILQGNSSLEDVANTNESWRVIKDFAYTPLLEDNKVIGAREQIFLEYYPFNFEKPDYSDSSWSKAKKVTSMGKKLVQRSIPFPEEIKQRFHSIRKMEGLPFNDSFLKGKGKLEVYPWATVNILVDLARLTTAYPELSFGGGKGSKITLTYLEAPFINVKNEEKGNRSEVDNKIISGIYDVIYPDGGENRVFRPLYFRTFRYVNIKIENYLQPLTINDFHSYFTGYPYKELASFKTNDVMLDSIWDIGWRTVRLCSYETFVDCPYYEQLQYIGDTRIQALISMYVSGDERLVKNALQQFADSRTKEGITHSRYPDFNQQIITTFSLFWVDMVHDYWRHRKDDQFVKSFIPMIKGVLNWHQQFIDKNTGMLGVVPYWNFVDWPKEWPWTGTDNTSGVPKTTFKGNSAIHSLIYSYTLVRAAELMKYYDMPAESKSYSDLADKINRATKKLCWDDNRKVLSNSPDLDEYSQHANVMGVLAGLWEKDTAQQVLQRTINDTTLIQCTVYFKFYLHRAVKEAGLGNRYLELLGSWKDMIGLGLTTFAEKPEPSRSDCHGWSASPNYDFLQIVLGIEPGSPGFASVRIAPAMGNLAVAEGGVPHPNGLIYVKYSKTINNLSAEITLPPATPGFFEWNGKRVSLKPGKQRIKL